MSGAFLHYWRSLSAIIIGVSAFVGQVQAVQPDFSRAEAFGIELQRKYAEKKSEAIIELLDSERLLRRVLEPLGGSLLDDPATHKKWAESFFPALVGELKSLDAIPTMMLSRVMLLGDGRYLECVLFTKEGRFSLMTLRLADNPDGRITIEDFRMFGAELEFSESTRSMLLVLGVSANRVLDAEELLLARLSPQVRPAANQLFAEMAQKRYEEAFRQWLRVPESMAETRYWRSVRTRLAMLGSKAAAAHLVNACRLGYEKDAVLRLSLLGSNEDPEGMLALVNDALLAHLDMPYLRVVKADLLLTTKRPEEALAVVRDVLALNPYCFPAYVVSLQAASVLNRPAETQAILSQWAGIVPLAAIEEALSTTPSTAALMKTKAYLEWRETWLKVPAQPAGS